MLFPKKCVLLSFLVLSINSDFKFIIVGNNCFMYKKVSADIGTEHKTTIKFLPDLHESYNSSLMMRKQEQD